jgi:hypothetical protein
MPRTQSWLNTPLQAAHRPLCASYIPGAMERRTGAILRLQFATKVVVFQGVDPVQHRSRGLSLYTRMVCQAYSHLDRIGRSRIALRSHQVATATTSQPIPANGRMIQAEFRGRSHHTTKAKAINPTLPIAAPAASTLAMDLPRATPSKRRPASSASHVSLSK